MSSVDFLAETNACGQTVLKLVSRGNAILAELLRLSEFIPPVFHMATKEERDMYHYILPDFSYFAKQDYYDMAVNTNPVSGACDVMSCVCVVMSCYMSLLSANVLSLHCHVMSCHVFRLPMLCVSCHVLSHVIAVPTVANLAKYLIHFLCSSTLKYCCCFL